MRLHRSGVVRDVNAGIAADPARCIPGAKCLMCSTGRIGRTLLSPPGAPLTLTVAVYETAAGATGVAVAILQFSTTISTRARFDENAWMSTTASSVGCAPIAAR